MCDVMVFQYLHGDISKVYARILGRSFNLVNVANRKWKLNQVLFADDTALVADSEKQVCQLVVWTSMYKEEFKRE